MDTLVNSVKTAVGLLLLAVLVGCGGGAATNPPEIDRSEQAKVEGTVTVQGKAFKGTGYQLVLMAENGQTSLISLNANGTFQGTSYIGNMKASVLPELQAQAAHGDASQAKTTVSVTVNPGENKGLKIDLPENPPAAPKASGGAGAAHSG